MAKSTNLLQHLAPGPEGVPLLGSLPDYQKDPLRLFMSAWQQFSDVVRFHIGPRLVHLVSHPDGIKHVLGDNSENYHKSVKYELVAQPAPHPNSDVTAPGSGVQAGRRSD